MKTGIQSLKMVPGIRRDDVWIPGRVSLARNDDSMYTELSTRTPYGAPGRAGGLLTCQLKIGKVACPLLSQLKRREETSLYVDNLAANIVRGS